MSRGRWHVDVLAAVAAVIATGMGLLYRHVLSDQGTSPTASVSVLVQAALLAGVLLCLFGWSRAPGRRWLVLLNAAAVLGIVGLLGILTIGVPVLLAALSAFVGSMLDRESRDRAPSDLDAHPQG